MAWRDKHKQRMMNIQAVGILAPSYSESFGDAGTHLLGDCGVTTVEDQLSPETPCGGEKQ